MALFKSKKKMRADNALRMMWYAEGLINNYGIGISHGPVLAECRPHGGSNSYLFTINFADGRNIMAVRAMPLKMDLTSEHKHGTSLYNTFVKNYSDRYPGINLPDPDLSGYSLNSCPRCEEGEILPGDYICSSCRYGS